MLRRARLPIEALAARTGKIEPVAFDFAKAVPLKPGSFMLHPAKATHWDGSGGAEAVIVQIMGEGPATTTQVDPSKPFWMTVPH